MDETPIRVLLVDDDSGYVSVIRHRLQSFPQCRFEVLWATDGDAAFDTLTKGGDGVDLVLMDYYLPRSNGLEVTRRIREASLRIPVILLTSNKDLRVAVEAMKYGVEDYLIKEEDIDTILPRTILTAVERFRLNERLFRAEKDRLSSREYSQGVQELVVTMCHEFNNPLAAIKISTDILLRRELPAETLDLLDRLNKDIKHLEDQIVKLRDLNTIRSEEEGKKEKR